MPTPSFDLLVVGAGGGPNESNLSGYLLKAHNQSWSDGVVGIEAGSGLGALRRILQENPDLLRGAGSSDSESPPPSDAVQIYANLRSYLITHCHLDHILSLVLLAGGTVTKGQRKSIRGSRTCLQGLETIFKPGRIWPNLASWKRNDLEELYLYDPLPDEAGVYTSLTEDIHVSMYPLSHGPETHSSAFFIRHTSTNREFLFFGDVEPDKLASSPPFHPSNLPEEPKGYNAQIWRAAASKIVSDVLDTIFIECSWPEGRMDKSLYGHLSPGHLVEELGVLAEAVASCRNRGHDANSEMEVGALTMTNIERTTTSGRKRASSNASPDRKRQRFDDSGGEEFSTAPVSPELAGALFGVRVYIIHCKEDMEGRYPGQSIHVVISDQVRTLVEERKLGATIIAVEQGQVIHI